MSALDTTTHDQMIDDESMTTVALECNAAEVDAWSQESNVIEDVEAYPMSRLSQRVLDKVGQNSLS